MSDRTSEAISAGMSAQIQQIQDTDFEILFNKDDEEKGYGAMYGLHLNGGEPATIESVVTGGTGDDDGELVVQFSLGNVPEEMHGWTVYAHLNGNGYKVNSERVQLLVYGMEPPADGPIEGPEDDADSDDSSSKKKADAEDSGETEPEEKSFTISCNEKALRKIDASGAAEEADPVNRIQFTSITSFEVKTEETFTSWTANGVRFEVEEPINGFKIQNLTTDLSLNLKIARPTEADAQRDESHMCAVKCVGCTFTSLQDNLRGATEGRVPAGTVIMVTADTAELRDAGAVDVVDTAGELLGILLRSA